jgi:hypothetical protein
MLQLNLPIDVLIDSLTDMLDSEDLKVEYLSFLIENPDYKYIQSALSSEYVSGSIKYKYVCNIRFFLLYFFSTLTDIYTNICINNNTANKENTFSIVYYGHAHIHTLKKILIKNGYVNKSQPIITRSFEDEEINRCINLEEAGFYFDVEEFLQR